MSSEGGPVEARPAAPATAKPITRTRANPGPDKLLGQTLGGCRLLKRIGRGGMGDVYLADHPEFGPAVAIKILPPDFSRNEELLTRFHREAAAALRAQHPNLVKIHSVGEDQDHHFIVMEYVEGRNVQDLVDEGKRLDPREAARVAFEVARGLQAVHEADIIHRDIKPANIIVSSNGSVKIVDFGLAFDAEDKSSLTLAGAIMGTPHYLSPEQAEGKRSTFQSDLYSLGVCLYFMVAGVRPFVGESHMAVLYKQIHGRPRDPRLHAPDAPDYLVELILKALEKQPERRFSTATEFARQLDRFLKGTYTRRVVAPRPAAPRPAPPRLAPRRLIPIGAVAAAAWIGVAVALASSVVYFAARPGADPAPVAAAPAPAPVFIPPSTPALPHLDLLTDADRKNIAQRHYAPVIQNLFERHNATAAPDRKAAVAKLGLRLTSAYRVVSQYRAVIAAERGPSLKLRDGRMTTYSHAAVPALHADSIVEYARKSREIGPLDLAFFLLVDGQPEAALDQVILGREIRPECRPHIEDIVAGVLAQARDPRAVGEKLSAIGLAPVAAGPAK